MFLICSYNNISSDFHGSALRKKCVSICFNSSTCEKWKCESNVRLIQQVSETSPVPVLMYFLHVQSQICIHIVPLLHLSFQVCTRNFKKRNKNSDTASAGIIRSLQGVPLVYAVHTDGRVGTLSAWESFVGNGGCLLALTVCRTLT